MYSLSYFLKNNLLKKKENFSSLEIKKKNLNLIQYLDYSYRVGGILLLSFIKLMVKYVEFDAYRCTSRQI